MRRQKIKDEGEKVEGENEESGRKRCEMRKKRVKRCEYRGLR